MIVWYFITIIVILVVYIIYLDIDAIYTVDISKFEYLYSSTAVSEFIRAIPILLVEFGVFILLRKCLR